MYVYLHTINHQKTHTMETITITHRIINGKSIFNKRFDNYDKGFYGLPISKAEYMESRQNEITYNWVESCKDDSTLYSGLDIVERLTYNN